ncbi:MAG TPA: hypothetical protein VK826_01785, partial [Bacteroidia bacterium]|nr:hypothetical protein [Bacteroidia bacterium]
MTQRSTFSQQWLCRTVISFVAFFIVQTAHAQLTGVKNIPGNYPTLAAAITDLNAQGVGAGGVVLNLLSGNPQTTPVGGYVITAQGTAATPIILAGNGNIITAATGLSPGSCADGIFKIVGGDYITLTQFVMQENAANNVFSPANSNTMTEWGVALLHSSTTNGAQFNTIISNTISLDINYQNAVGVYSNSRHFSTSPGTVSEIVNNTTAPNSNNHILQNNISNVNVGVIFCGSVVPANMNQLNEIDGNTITNYGGQPHGTGFVGITSAQVFGIYVINECFHTISDNTLIAAPFNTGYGVRCIMTDFSAVPSGSVTNTITRNTVTFSQAGTASVAAIHTNSSVTIGSLTLNVTDNLVTNCDMISNGSLSGITNSAAAGTVNITGNTFRNNIITGTGGF